MTGPENTGRGQSLAELLALWQAWNSSDVTDRAARRADAAGNSEQAEKLRALNHGGPSALAALAAQHELTSLLEGWRWHTVLAAREQGATWADIADAAHPGAGDPDAARAEFLERIARARDAETRFDIPFHDAERYAAAAPDIAAAPDDARDQQETEQETTAMTTDPQLTDTAAGTLIAAQDSPGVHGPTWDDPGLALEDTWFRASLEQAVPPGTPDRAAVIDAAVRVARDRFVADGSTTDPEQALELLDGHAEDPSGALAPMAWISPAPVEDVTAADLLVRAERADNRTYLAGTYVELDAAYRELEAVEGEAHRRAETTGAGTDRALAEYLGLLVDDPGVERFEEYTALHNTVHHALGVPATVPDASDTEVGPAAARVRGALQAEATGRPDQTVVGLDGPGWERGDDAASWTAERDPDAVPRGAADGLVVGSIVLPGGLPPDDGDDQDDHGPYEGHEPRDGHGGELSGVNADRVDAYDRGPWSEPSTGLQWESLGAWARDSAAEPVAREAASPGRGARIDEGPEIARRLAQVRAQLAARDAAYTDTDAVPAPREHTDDDIAAAYEPSTVADTDTDCIGSGEGMDEGWGR